MNMKNLPHFQLEQICRKFRKDLIDVLYHAQSGHPGGSLSLTEIIVTLYYNILNIDPENPNWSGRDRIVLSKGHGAPMMYVAMAELGFFSKDELYYLRKAGFMLQGHPCTRNVPGVDYTAGPLGLGLSYAVGIAAGAKRKNHDFYTYAIVGDGEMQEGCIWEAVLSASKFKLDHLITIIDNNKVQLDGKSAAIMPMGDIRAKLEAFGCNVITIDGHNTEEIEASISLAKNTNGKHSVILADTIKGKGISFMEGKSCWHGAEISDYDYQQALGELEVELVASR